MFWMTYYDSNVFILYGINYATVNLYFLSAIVIAIFSVLNLILSFYTLEAYLGIDYSKPIRDLLDRFQARKVFWVADEKYDEE